MTIRPPIDAKRHFVSVEEGNPLEHSGPATSWLRIAYRWASQILDPVKIGHAPKGYSQYLRSWKAYRRIDGAEPLRLTDSHPQIHDRTPTTTIDSHYFYANAWAMRNVVESDPAIHVDVASHHIFVGMLAGVVPVIFVDYRPLEAPLSSLHRVAGDALRLPFATDSIRSLSCIHAAEHVGLGRYGDSLDPEGTRKSCRELARVLAPRGHLQLAVPVGRHRTCFNAHRVHSARAVVSYFENLELLGFGFVDDAGRYFDDAPLDQSDPNEYGCGLFRFRKP